MTARVTIIVCLLLAAAAPGVAYADTYGTELPFASGTSARAAGMGLAATSLPGTPCTQYFNPALLATQDRQAFEFYRTTLFDSDTQYHSAAYIHPSLDWGALGVTVLRLDVSGIEERDATNMLLSSDLKNTQTRLLLGYALGILPSVAAGVNFKIDHQSFGSYNGSAVGVDIGFLATRSLSRFAWLRTVRGSLVAENALEPKVKLDQEDVPDPRRIIIGLSIEGGKGDIGAATSLDLVSPKYSPFHARFGQEVSYRDMVAIRAGVDGTTPTFGVGGTYRSVSLDYAYRDEDLGSNHRVSLSVAFGPSLDEARTARRMREDAALQERVRSKVSEFEHSQLIALTRQADRFFAEGDVQSARKTYEMVLMWDPQNAHAAERIPRCDLEDQLQHARAARDNDDHATALHHYRRASKYAPDDARVIAGLASCDSVIVESESRAAVAGDLMTKAFDLYAHGDYPGALAALEDAVQLDPENGVARELLEKSRASVAAAIENHLRQARIHERGGDLEAAVASLERAASMSANRHDIEAELSRLGGLLEREEATPPAVETVDEPTFTVDSDVDFAALDKKYEAGIRSFERGAFAESAQLLSQVWTIAPDYRDVADPLVRAYLFHGMALYGDGRYEEAIGAWQRVLVVDPDNQKSKRYLRKVREESSRLSGGSR
jgi:tetratricopeptide (TPR) repeat protein